MDIIDLYARKTDPEVNFILNQVEKVNNIEFAIPDRVRLYKLFRYRYFNLLHDILLSV